MAYDSIRRRIVLFGGDGSSDTWEWDGSTWLLMTPAQRPVTRENAAMAFDVRRGRIVLFGGGWDHPETWLWDGTNRTIGATSGPERRTAHDMAYDKAREVVVLFGGVGPSGPRNDLWEWDGTLWRQVMPLNQAPSPPYLHKMIYHAARGRLVVFGGTIGPLYYIDETWEWDGATRMWTRALPPNRPGRVYLEDMAYDSRRQRAILFGGFELHTGTLHDGTWTYQDLAIAAVPASPRVGETVSLAINAPRDASGSYVLAASTGRIPGIGLSDGREVSLLPDALFQVSLGSSAPPFAGFAGALDGSGRGMASVSLPPDPVLTGFSFVVGGVVYDATSIRTVLNETPVVVRSP